MQLSKAWGGLLPAVLNGREFTSHNSDCKEVLEQLMEVKESIAAIRQKVSDLHHCGACTTANTIGILSRSCMPADAADAVPNKTKRLSAVKALELSAEA